MLGELNIMGNVVEVAIAGAVIVVIFGLIYLWLKRRGYAFVILSPINAKDAPQFRGCLTIQNHNKKKPKQGFISENTHAISQNI